MKKIIFTSFFAFLLGLTANSIDVETSKPFRFSNPIAIGLTEKQIEEIVDERPIMYDTIYSLDLFNFNIPLFTNRTVNDKASHRDYSGKLDSKGNIHSPNGVYELQSAHDSNWYIKRK